MTPAEKADKEMEVIAWMNKKGYDRKASKDIAPIIVTYLDEVVKNKSKMIEQTFTHVERSHSGNLPVMCRFLFQYRSIGKDLMVHIEANSLNDAMVVFATHCNFIDEVYEIAKVS